MLNQCTSHFICIHTKVVFLNYIMYNAIRPAIDLIGHPVPGPKRLTYDVPLKILRKQFRIHKRFTENYSIRQEN